MNSVSGIVYVAAAAFALLGLGLIVFPGIAKKWSDAQYNDPRRIKPAPPAAARLRSKGSYRAMGVGLLAVACLLAYYGYSLP